MFDSVKNFLNRGDNNNNERQKLEAEAKNFKLPSEAGPKVVKYVVFPFLAFLNFRLFYKLVPGPMGIVTGAVAVLAEYLALYAYHNFSRTSGAFRVVLGLSGIGLAAFSITHGVFSFFDMIHVAELSQTVHYYSQTVAFPLLLSLITISSIAMGLTHPVNVVRLKQALAHTSIITGRAEAASELELMRAQSIVESARLDRQRERIRRESEYLVEVERLIAIEQKKRAMVALVSDPDLREALARELGIEVPKASAASQGPQVARQSSPWPGGQAPVIHPRGNGRSVLD